MLSATVTPKLDHPLAPPSTAAFISLAILGCLAAQAVLIFTQPVNWDEFRFLADVHLLARQELTAPVQTFHAHLFKWLLQLPGDEIDQIIGGRIVMLMLECGIAALIYRCARRFTGLEASLLSVLGYVSFSFVISHGASFRFDPPSTFLLMAATTLVATARLRMTVTALIGILVGLSALITIKSVFYVPTIVAVACWRICEADQRRLLLLRLGAGAMVGAAVLALLFLYHQSNLVHASAPAPQELVSSNYDKTIGQSQLFPRGAVALRSMLENPLQWMLFIGGFIAAVAGFARMGSDRRIKALALASFGFPLATLLFYRNAFPYYYIFILAPLAVLGAVAAEKLAKHVRLHVAAVLLLLSGLVHAKSAASPPILAAQRDVLKAVHAVFPRPIAYIDRCSMIPSSRKQGIFMSTWGLEVYRDARRPIFREILLRERPAYLLANSPSLEAALGGAPAPLPLLPEDAATLRGNFIPHWGPIWVAGKELNVEAQPIEFEVLVTGPYTIETSTSIRLDGAARAPGEVVVLGPGLHRISSIGRSGPVTLRWGNHLRKPSAPPPAAPLFGGL